MARIRSLTPILVLLLGALALGCASDEEKVAEHVAAAERYQAEGDHRSALVELKSALGVQPKNAALNRKLADLYEAMQQPGRAAFFYGEAYRLDPSQTDAALLQAPSLYGTDLDGAEALVREILEKEPENPEVHARWSEVLLLRGDTDGALRAALTAVELAPEDVRARRMVTSVQRSRVREALLAKKTPEPALYEAALAAADEAAALAEQQERPQGWYDRIQQALIYADWEGHDAEAQAAIKEAYRLAKAHDSRSGLLTVTREARRLAVAERDLEFRRWVYERWVEVEPDAVQAWRRLAALAREVDGTDDAIWERALTERADDVAMHAEYVRMLDAMNRRKKAKNYLNALPEELASTVEIGALRVEMALGDQDFDQAAIALADLKRRHPDDPLTRVVEAAFDLRSGQVDKGLLKLRSLSGQVERADVFQLLAAAEARKGNTDAAMAAIERSLALAPAQPMAHALRIQMLAESRDWMRVLRGWRDMRQLGLPTDVIEPLRIQALYETGRTAVARRLLDAALSAEEPSSDLVLLFVRYEYASQPERAHDLLEAAAKRDPANRAIAGALVRSELAAGNREKALERMSTFEDQTGQSPGSILQARLLFSMGREEEAEQAVIDAFRSRPRPFGAGPLLVEILTARGKQDKAIELLTESRAEGTLMPAGLWQLGHLHYANGDLDAALPPLEEAYRANPDFDPAMVDLALVLADLGRDLDRAVELARRAKARNPDNAAIADALGYVYLKKGLAEPAAFEFRSAIELARVSGSEVAEFHYHLGLALQAQGRAAEAQQAFAETLRIEPEHAKAQQAQAAGGAG